VILVDLFGSIIREAKAPVGLVDLGMLSKWSPRNDHKHKRYSYSDDSTASAFRLDHGNGYLIA
jgi:hypothetical protein